MGALRQQVALLLIICFIAGSGYGLTSTTLTVGTPRELITAINTANTNSDDDVIDLNGLTIMLISADNDMDGPNGLPIILADSGSSLTIKNGTITRGNNSEPFRHLFIRPLA